MDHGEGIGEQNKCFVTQWICSGLNQKKQLNDDAPTEQQIEKFKSQTLSKLSKQIRIGKCKKELNKGGMMV